MTAAMTGETATMTRGMTIAPATARTAAGRGIVTSGEDNITTGNKVIAEIAQSGSIRTCSSRATSMANRNGATNAITRMRRSRSRGQQKKQDRQSDIAETAADEADR